MCLERDLSTKIGSTKLGLDLVSGGAGSLTVEPLSEPPRNSRRPRIRRRRFVSEIKTLRRLYFTATHFRWWSPRNSFFHFSISQSTANKRNRRSIINFREENNRNGKKDIKRVSFSDSFLLCWKSCDEEE